MMAGPPAPFGPLLSNANVAVRVSFSVVEGEP